MVDDGSMVGADPSDVAGDNAIDVVEESILFNNKDAFSGLLHADDWWDNQALTPRNGKVDKRTAVELLPAMEIFPALSIDDTLTSMDTFVSTSPIRTKKTDDKRHSAAESVGEAPIMKVLTSTGNSDISNSNSPLTLSPIQTKNVTKKAPLFHAYTIPFIPPSSSSTSMTSVEWVDTLGDHVDINFSEGIFEMTDVNKMNGNCELTKYTRYDEVPSLISIPSDIVEIDPRNNGHYPGVAVPPISTGADEKIKWTPLSTKEAVSQVPSKSKVSSSTKQKTAGTAKQKTIGTTEPKNLKLLKYIDNPTEMDVLNGGGLSHPGNKRFMEKITKWQPSYLGTKDKSERSKIIENVIHYVHYTQEGRFLEQDTKTGRWHVATPGRIRHKVSRTLRESNGHRRRARAAKKGTAAGATTATAPKRKATEGA